MKTIGFLALLATVAAAQPIINTGGIVNAASYAPAGLPNAAIAQGSIFLIFGKNLGPANIVQAAFPLPTTLSGTSVRITVGGQSVSGIMIYTLASQVACVLPSSTPTGTGTLVLTYNNQPSAAAPITVVRSSFGIFTTSMSGMGPGVLTDANYQRNFLNFSARPREVWVLWGTGLGPVSFDETRGAPVEDMRTSDVQVFVGGRSANISFRGRSPGSSALDQINFEVPEGVEGCYVPLAVRVGGLVSNFASIAVSSGRRTCSDPHGFSDTEIDQAQSKNDYRVGAIALMRTEISLPAIPGLGELGAIKMDTGAGTFARFDFRKLVGSTGSGYAPFGHCTVFTFRGTDYMPKDPALPDGLDAGALSVTGPAGTKQFKQDPKGVYSAELGGGGIPGFPGGQPDFLVKGAYTARAAGGADVEAFTATLNIPDPLTWTNRAEISNIARASNLTVRWSGGDQAREYVVIIGASLRSNPEVGAAFQCTERAAAGSFTVPSLVLSALPPSDPPSATSMVPTGMLMLGSAPLMAPNKFNARGLDAGYFYYTMLSGKTVSYQ